jgi:hypothetical protein
MMKRLQHALAGALLLFCPGLVFGADFGAVLRINPEWKGAGAETDNAYAFTLDPWISASPHKTFDIYLSGGISLRYEQEEWKLLPELNRFIFAWRPLPGFSLEAGRGRFSDPNGIIAEGLFDGLSVSWEPGGSRLSAGGYYSGFLYKDTADIYMTPSDIEDYLKPLDWEDPAATYFASRRVLASVSWEIPALAGSPHGLYLQGLGQFDLNGTDDWLHSQYLSLRFLFSPLPVFTVTTGGVLGLTEQAERDIKIAPALLVDAGWYLPTALRDMVSLGFRWGSGGTDKESGGMGSFLPVTCISQGNVWSSTLPGLMLIRAAYTLRPHETLALALDGRYFFLDNNRDEKALGGEIYVSITWAPVIDTALTVGAGVFLPNTGNALPSGTPPRWLVSLGLTVSF